MSVHGGGGAIVRKLNVSGRGRGSSILVGHMTAQGKEEVRRRKGIGRAPASEKAGLD